MPRNLICIIDWLGEGPHGSSSNCSTAFTREIGRSTEYDYIEYEVHCL